MSNNTIIMIVFFRLIFSICFVESDKYKSSGKIRTFIGKIEKVHIDKHKLLPVVEKRPHYDTVGTNATVEMLVALIRDGKEKIIGLYGESVSRNNDILSDLHKKLESNALGFDRIIWVSVSTPVNISKIMDQIGRRVLIDYRNLTLWRSESQRLKSFRIHEALMNIKFLLIFDGISERVDLETVGVPELITNTRGSKVIFTCRSRFVCGHMGAQKFIQVKPLSLEDSWTLFSTCVTCHLDNSLDDPEICRLAKEVCSQCHGVPEKLINTGSSMALATTVAEWKRCLETQFKK